MPHYHVKPRVFVLPAFPQELPHQGDPWQEDEAEQAYPSLDPPAHGQQDPVRFVLVSHEARRGSKFALPLPSPRRA